MEKVRWGIIGPGKIAHQFARDIRHTSNAHIVAVASKKPKRAQSFASQYEIPKVHEDYQALFNDPEVDAVYIATTHNFHLENSRDAILSGKAVLCEKPLTDKLADTKALAKLAQEQGIYLMEGMWTYFLPTILKAQAWINQGRIGEVFNLKANFGYAKVFDPNSRLFNPALSGGSLLDMGIYPVAMAWLFMQDNPQKYHVVAEKAPTGVDYDVNAMLIYPDKRVANLHSSFKVKLNNNCYIFGEKGYIEIPDFWQSTVINLYQGDELIDHFEDHRAGEGFEFEIEAASEDIINGRLESAIMPHNSSIKLQEFMDQIIGQF